MRGLLPAVMCMIALLVSPRATAREDGETDSTSDRPGAVMPLRLGDPSFRGPLARGRGGVTGDTGAENDAGTAESGSEMLYNNRLLCLNLPGDLHGETVGPVHATRLWLMAGTMAAANAAIAVYFFETYYNDDFATRAPFHTFNDWYNADLNVDKLGHVWSAQAYAQALYHMFRWANLRETDAMYWSSGLAFFFQLEMEITDGLFEKWGFSWWDMAANTIGAAWPNLQRAYPSLRPFMLKMSYHPSAAVRKGWVEHDYLRDYDGFTYWLALSVEDLLPADARPWWPDWLGIAVGYGANNTMLGEKIYNSRDGVGQGEQEWYIALDYDLRKLPGDTAFLRWLKESLNIFHLPAPAIRITPSAVYYGLYF